MRGWSCKVCSKRISSRLKKNEAWCECIDKALQLIEDHQRIAYTVSLFGTSGNGEAPFRPGHLRWAGSHNDLVELAIALQEQGVIVDATGQRAGYAPLLRLLCDAFGIRVDNIYVKKTFVLDRSDSASFLRKLLAAFDRTVEEHLKYPLGLTTEIKRYFKPSPALSAKAVLQSVLPTIKV